MHWQVLWHEELYVAIIFHPCTDHPTHITKLKHNAHVNTCLVHVCAYACVGVLQFLLSGGQLTSQIRFHKRTTYILTNYKKIITWELLNHNYVDKRYLVYGYDLHSIQGVN